MADPTEPTGGEPEPTLDDFPETPNGEPTQSVDVELDPADIPDGAEAAPAPEVASAAGQPKKPKLSREEKRIETLTQRNRESETVAERLSRENDELKRGIETERQKGQQAHNAALVNFEQRVDLGIDSAKAALREAVSSGDVEAQIDATQRLGSLNVEKSRLDAWKASHPQGQPQQQQPQPQQPAQQPQQQRQQLTPEVRAFVSDNSWFNPQADDFNQSMHQVAVAEATKLEHRYRRQGNEDQIGSKAYFDAVLNAVRDEFPEEFDDDDDPVPAAQPNGGVPQMTRPNGSIATAARGAGGAPGGNGAASSNKVTLSKEERGMARQLAASGALNKPNGQRPTDAEAERIYAIQKVRTAVPS
jgi:hypothetical protein